MFGQSEQMFDKLNQNKINLADQRLSDLVFSSTYVKAFIGKIKTNILGKEYGFTSQFLVKFVDWNNLNISWPSQKYPKNLRNSFSET